MALAKEWLLACGFTAIVPTVKVATNIALYDKMTVNMDNNAGMVIEGKETVKQQHIFDEMIRVANGKLTKAEFIGHNDFGILAYWFNQVAHKNLWKED